MVEWSVDILITFGSTDVHPANQVMLALLPTSQGSTVLSEITPSETIEPTVELRRSSRQRNPPECLM